MSLDAGEKVYYFGQTPANECRAILYVPGLFPTGLW
jgi:hypothetical protein